MSEIFDRTYSELAGDAPSDGDERIFLQEEAKLYHAKAILAFLSSNDHYDFSQTVFTFSENPLPINNEEGKLIGFAAVERRNDRLLGDLAIDYSTPERLSAETRDGLRYYPRLVGEMFLEPASDTFLDTFGRCRAVQWMVVDGLVLSTKAPRDFRLQPLGELILL